MKHILYDKDKARRLATLLLLFSLVWSAHAGAQESDAQADPLYYPTYHKLGVKLSQENYLRSKTTRTYIRSISQEGYIDKLRTEMIFIFASKNNKYIIEDTFMYRRDTLGRISHVKRQRLRDDSPEGVQEEPDSFSYGYDADGMLARVARYQQGKFLFAENFAYDSVGRLLRRRSEGAATTGETDVWELHYDEKGRNTLTSHYVRTTGDKKEKVLRTASFHIYDSWGYYGGQVQRQAPPAGLTNGRYVYPLCVVILNNDRGLPQTVESFLPGKVAAANWNNIFKSTPEEQAADWQLIRCPEGDNDRDQASAFSQFTYKYFNRE